MRRTALVVTLGVLVLAAIAIGSVRALNTTTPKSVVCTDFGDRITKLQLMDRLSRAPHVLVLGSSRARPAMPATVERLTGGPAFNAGVPGGSAADEYVFTRLLAERFPQAKVSYLIFVDVNIAVDGVNPDLADEPLARPFLGKDASSGKTTCTPNHRYTASGGLAYPPQSKAQRERLVASMLPSVLAGIKSASLHPKPIVKADTLYFQRLLAFMNSRGAKPVIVLDPLYPAVLAKRLKYGFPQRKEALAYLAWLRHRYRFVLVNGEDIRKWGGKASDFANVDHIDRVNMNRLLAYVVRHSDGVLTR